MIIGNKIRNITIFQKNKIRKGFAFIEFDSYKIAKRVLQEYNNKSIMNIDLKLCWPKDNIKDIKNLEKFEKEEDETEEDSIFTVRYILYKKIYLLL